MSEGHNHEKCMYYEYISGVIVGNKSTKSDVGRISCFFLLLERKFVRWLYFLVS